MRKFIDKIDRFFAQFENAVIIIGLSVMFLILLAQIFMRYLLNSPLIWSEEVARFIFVYVSFIGISFAYRENTHIRMEAVVNILPVKMKRFLDAAIQIGTILLFLYMIPFSFKFIGIQAKVKSTAAHIPMSIVYLALPLGMFLSCIRIAIGLLRLYVFNDKEERL